MSIAQRLSETEYEQFVQSTPDGVWELHDGRLVEKPGMSWEHGGIVMFLGHDLLDQLDPREFRVFTELRIRRPSATVFQPDLMVVPSRYGREFAGRPGTLAIFSDPLPLVVEIWSASTGGYDVDTKIPIYQQRGDLEIWRIHPYERTLTRWVRHADGSYEESVLRGGVVVLAVLPGVTIDLDRLFELASMA
jgi:Uma2 family endonuclease